MTNIGDPDLLVFADEAGSRGYVRDLKPEQDHEISLICTLPIPAEFLEPVKSTLNPLFEKFKAAAPVGAKIHITEAYAKGNDKWREVADEVREELFRIMHEMRIIIVYSARRLRFSRERHEEQMSIKTKGLASRKSDIKITNANRPSDEQVDDEVMIGLALMIDAFCELNKKSRADLVFDEIDKAVAARYEAALERTRNIGDLSKDVKGWDPKEKKVVIGKIDSHIETDFRLKSEFLGKIDVVGKDDPLIFAVDVVANHLWRHLCSLDNTASLNTQISIENWALGDLVWGADDENGLDSF